MLGAEAQNRRSRPSPLKDVSTAIGRYPLKANGSPLTPIRCCFSSICYPGSVLNILIKIKISLAAMLLHTGKMWFCCHICQTWNHHITASGTYCHQSQCGSSPKYGLSELNHSAAVGLESMAMIWRNCGALRLRLENVNCKYLYKPCLTVQSYCTSCIISKFLIFKLRTTVCNI